MTNKPTNPKLWRLGIAATTIIGIGSLLLLPYDHFPERRLFKNIQTQNLYIASENNFQFLLGNNLVYYVEARLEPKPNTNFSQATAFYTQELLKTGWTLLGRPSPNDDTVTYKNGTRTLTISALPPMGGLYNPKDPEYFKARYISLYDTATSLPERLRYALRRMKN